MKFENTRRKRIQLAMLWKEANEEENCNKNTGF